MGEKLLNTEGLWECSVLGSISIWVQRAGRTISSYELDSLSGYTSESYKGGVSTMMPHVRSSQSFDCYGTASDL